MSTTVNSALYNSVCYNPKIINKKMFEKYSGISFWIFFSIFIGLCWHAEMLPKPLGLRSDETKHEPNMKCMLW